MGSASKLNKSKMPVPLRAPLSVLILKFYAKFINTKLFYRQYVIRGKENIPPTGTPTIIASNHQNCMLDPLAIIYTLDSYAKFLTRASVFSNPFIARIIRKIGLLPAYRLEVDGEAATKNNTTTWATTQEELLGGQAIVIFPEGKHQHQRTMGEFQSGYLRIAFDAAVATDFQQDILILPSANHYSNFSHMQCDLQITFGEAIHLKDFYELYKTKPRTAQRQVNALVRERIDAIMLNISNLENYEAMEFLTMEFSKVLAREDGLNPRNISTQLYYAQKVNNAIKKIDEEHAEEKTKILADALTLKQFIDERGTRLWLFDKGADDILLHTLGLLILFPLFVISLIPNVLVYLTPYLITPKLHDKRFEATVYVGISLATIPIYYIAFFFLELNCTESLIISVIHLLFLPILGLFGWWYKIWFIKLIGKIRYEKCKKFKNFSEIATIFERLRKNLSEIIKH